MFVRSYLEEDTILSAALFKEVFSRDDGEAGLALIMLAPYVGGRIQLLQCFLGNVELTLEHLKRAVI